MAGSNINSIVGPRSGVFIAIGANDLDNSGEIEKTSLLKPWKKDEGYNEKADLDKNGKISIAEAKFFLWYLSDASEGTKQKYPINGEDKIVIQRTLFGALDAAKEQKDPEARVKALLDTAVKMKIAQMSKDVIVEVLKESINEVVACSEEMIDDFSLGDLLSEMTSSELDKDTVVTALKEASKEYITKPSDHINEISDFSVAFAKLGLFKEARETYNIIDAARDDKYPDLKIFTLTDIALEMSKAGFSKHSIALMFAKAVNIAHTVKRDEEKVALYRNIANRMAKAGMSESSVVSVYNMAIRLVQTTKERDMWIDNSIQIIALEMSKEGINKRTVSSTFKKSIIFASRDYYKNSDFRQNIVVFMQKAGLSNKEIISLYKECGVDISEVMRTDKKGKEGKIINKNGDDFTE
jgi:hypothetical protein